MAIFKKEKKRRSFVCAFCGRSIDLSTEPDGEIKRHDNKPACVICRATKLSPLADLIKKGKVKYNTQKRNREKESKKEALVDVMEIAYASQQKAGKGLMRLDPKKFLK